MNISHLKLGKHQASDDPRTLLLEKYTAALPTPSANCGWISRVRNYPMFSNNTLGDCVEAAMAHMEQRWTAYAGKPWTPTDAQVVSEYSKLTGYIPGDPSTDQGTNMLQALRGWRKNGFAGHKIFAFLRIDPTKPLNVMQSVALFGGCITGLNLPLAAQTPVTGANGLPCWALPASVTSAQGAPGGWGGHCVDLGGYGVDAKGNKGTEIITWGQVYDMTWDFIAEYSDEMYAIVTEDWIEKDGKSPSGFDVKTLLADLRAIG
jgi:hypothetical protein